MSAEQSKLPATAILGAGSMGGAILEGLLNADPDLRVSVTTGTAESARNARALGRVTALSAEEDPDANRRAVAGAKVVIIGVKPWGVLDLLRDIADDLESGAIVASVAAGITIPAMQAVLPEGVTVVRAMPNLPTVIGLGVTGIAAAPTAPDAAVAAVRAVFETVGRVVVTDESRIDAVTAVSGSGPGYLFLFAEEFLAAATRIGFSEEDARTLAIGTVEGAAALLASSGEEPAELRRRITSPAGTTEAALGVLTSGGWADLFDRALAAAENRAGEIAAEQASG